MDLPVRSISLVGDGEKERPTQFFLSAGLDSVVVQASQCVAEAMMGIADFDLIS